MIDIGFSVSVVEWRNGETSLHTSSFELQMEIGIGSVGMLCYLWRLG